MNYTPNYQLQKPLSTEKYTVSSANQNADLLDSILHNIETKNNSQDALLATKESLTAHADNRDNPHQITKAQIGLANLTNDRQVKGLAGSVTENHIVVFGSDGYTIMDSGCPMQEATTDTYGITILEDSIDSITTDRAATANSVKIAYDLAAAALPKDGGTMTGPVILAGDPLETLEASTKQYVDQAYANSNLYTDTKISELVSGAPETLDTLKELADAISENQSVVETLDEAIGKKASQTILDTHTSNHAIHITANERTSWNDAAGHTGDTTRHITADERSLWNTVADKVSAVAGKGLSTNDFTNALKTDYDAACQHSQTAHAPVNAEKNTIVGVQKNGLDIAVDSVSRKVNITVPTKLSQLENDSGFVPSGSDQNTTYTLNTNTSAVNGNAKINLIAGGSGSGTQSIAIQGGTNTTVTTDAAGTLIVTSTNTDTKVTQAASSTANYRPLLLGYNDSTDSSALTGTITNQVYQAANLYVQPSTGTLYANAIVGDVTGSLTGNAASATTAANAVKATQDESGNNIKASYGSSLALNGSNILLKSKSGATLTTLSLAALSGAGSSIAYSATEPSSLADGMTWIEG